MSLKCTDHGWDPLLNKDRGCIIKSSVLTRTQRIKAVCTKCAVCLPHFFFKQRAKSVALVTQTSRWSELANGVFRPVYVDKVCDPTLTDEDDEILAGVGFGPNFYSQVKH